MEKVEPEHTAREVVDACADCLSCRLQFNQLMPYAVYHPIEILNESYANFQA